MSTYQTTVEVDVDIPYSDIARGPEDEGKMLITRPPEKNAHTKRRLN